MPIPNLANVSGSFTTLTVGWTGFLSGASTYTIFRGIDNGALASGANVVTGIGVSAGTIASGNTSLTITRLTGGHQYVFQFSGNGLQSNPVTGNTSGNTFPFDVSPLVDNSPVSATGITLPIITGILIVDSNPIYQRTL